ncbi:MAG: tyrosine-protein phosphatase [Actinobacteria bacterium]|nr:tyrosine-protein phosphatase [Actinomycetota bacterium]
MTTADSRRVQLDGPANFRDLGGYPTLDGRRLRRGRVFRSDSLSHMSETDTRHVAEVLGVVTVVDLRAAHEVETFGHGPLGTLGVVVHHLPIVDETRPEHAERADDVPDPSTMELGQIYRMMLERFGHRFAAVLDVIANPANQPVVFHCAAGKDRTGLVAALLLGALGVDDDIVAADYAITAEHMDELIARHRERALESADMAEVSEQLFTAEAAVMRVVLEQLRASYGSAAEYLASHGLSAAALDALRSSLLE